VYIMQDFIKDFYKIVNQIQNHIIRSSEINQYLHYCDYYYYDNNNEPHKKNIPIIVCLG
jgi:hypothetical protein